MAKFIIIVVYLFLGYLGMHIRNNYLGDAYDLNDSDSDYNDDFDFDFD